MFGGGGAALRITKPNSYRRDLFMPRFSRRRPARRFSPESWASPFFAATLGSFTCPLSLFRRSSRRDPDVTAKVAESAEAETAEAKRPEVDEERRDRNSRTALAEELLKFASDTDAKIGQHPRCGQACARRRSSMPLPKNSHTSTDVRTRNRNQSIVLQTARVAVPRRADEDAAAELKQLHASTRRRR